MKTNKSFTLVETLIVTFLVMLVSGIALTALHDSHIRAEIVSATAKADAMNRAIQAAKVDGLNPPSGTVEDVHEWLVANRYLRPEEE